MFCAIATTIDRCKTEGVVDVFQVVKALRIDKPGAVLNVVSNTVVQIKANTYSSTYTGTVQAGPRGCTCVSGLI